MPIWRRYEKKSETTNCNRKYLAKASEPALNDDISLVIIECESICIQIESHRRNKSLRLAKMQLNC